MAVVVQSKSLRKTLVAFRQLILQFRSKNKFEKSDNDLTEDRILNQLLPVN